MMNLGLGFCLSSRPDAVGRGISAEKFEVSFSCYNYSIFILMVHKKVKIIKVLVASPGDVAEERKMVQKVINAWNKDHGAERGITLLAYFWETDSASEMGERPQQIINQQIVDKCHFAIAFFWTRIGTDTGVAQGGAVEEIERMRSQGKQVMLYFSNASPDLNSLDPEQLIKLRQYRASLQKDALITEYKSLDEFRAKLLRQLDMQVPRWFCQPSGNGGDAESEDGKPYNALQLHLYHAALKEELRWIRMLGLPGMERVDVNLDDDTFVPLRISRRAGSAMLLDEKSMMRGIEVEHLLTPDAVMQQAFRDSCRMLLIIGDPGSGKTTLLKYYALCCLEDGRSQKLGFSEPVTVFYLPLRELVRQKSGHYDTLPANLSLLAENQQLTIDKKLFDNWLRNGKVLVLLDGLDEISDREDRKEVCRWIEGASRGFSTACFVVTSRRTGYRKEDGIELAVDYEQADVQDFSEEQQERFLKNWFRAAFLRQPGEGVEWQQKQQVKADKLTEKIVAHLKEPSNRGLRQLAAIPMILQIMAILWKDRDHLPKSRVKLYNAVLDYLLEIRDDRIGIRPLLSAEDSRLVLGPVSLWMQEELKSDEVEKEKMQAIMQERCEYLDNPPVVATYCEFLVERAGLLVEYGKDYLFRHKSFREYLASVELLKKVDRTTGYLDILIEGFEDDWWDEPLRFFIAQGDEKVFDLFMEKLFDSALSDDLLQKKQGLLLTLIDEAPLKKSDALSKKLSDPKNSATRQRVILDCLKAIGKPVALDALQVFRERELAVNSDVASRLEEVIIALGGTALNRKAEKNVSGKLLSFRNEHEQSAEYILIPGGRFIYSPTKKQVSVEELYVAKYPVTNRLYRAFIASLQAKDSKTELFIKELNTIARNKTWDAGFITYLNKGKSDLAGLFRSGRDDDRKFGGDDQPVVSITWYAARAYCLWLSLLEGEKHDLYRLPTETEWEWAAGGIRDGTVQKVRPYPWPKAKGEPTIKLANYDDCNIGATTPVGQYPDGATPEGLLDMAGNVWEWMENLYDENTSEEYYKSARALRGGSWNLDSVNLCCDARLNILPINSNFDFGFRLVRSSHFFSS
jgi:formylglycine-generating enzyme required for sulfatase activity